MVFESMMFVPVMGDFDRCRRGQRVRRQGPPCFSQRCPPVCCQSTSESGPDFGLDLIRDLMWPFIAGHQDQVSKSRKHPKCSQWRKWSEDVQLPQDFMSRHLQSVEVDGGKVTFTLRKMGMDHNGFQDLTAKRQISLPEAVVESSIKIIPMEGGKIRIVGLQKLRQTDNPQSKVESEPEKSSDPKEVDQEVQDSSMTEKINVQSLTGPVDDGEDEDDTVSEQEFVMLSEDRTDEEEKGCCKSSTADSPCDTMDCDETETCCLSDDTSEASECATEQKSTTGAGTENAGSTPKDYSASIQMSPFHPKEITIKLTGHELAIDAVHKDEDDGQVSSFEMHRSLAIPENVNLDKLVTRMSEGGELVITAPYMDKNQYERELSIDMDN